MNGRTDHPVDILLGQIYLHMKNPKTTIDEAWKNAIDITYCDEPLKPSDIEIMKKCGDFLGQSDINSQKRHFQWLMEQIERQISYAEEEYNTKNGLYSKAGVAVGLVFVIALV